MNSLQSTVRGAYHVPATKVAPSPALPRFLLVWGVTSLVAVLLLALFGNGGVGIDDANIFFVYAKHLAQGAGFTYNAGGEHVEGFTSLLWTLIAAAAFRLSARPEPFLLLASITLVAIGLTAATLFIEQIVREVHRGRNRRTPWIWAVYLGVILTTPAFSLWMTVTLMDNALWSALLLLLTLLVTGVDISRARLTRVGVPLIVALLLTRPESLLWAPCFLLVLLLRHARGRGWHQALRIVLPMAAASALTVLALTAFRLWYFGFPLPNTYYAKVAPSLIYNLSEGRKYLASYITSDPLTCLVVLCVFMAAIHAGWQLTSKRAFRFERLLALPLLAMVGLAAPVLTGGDHFGAFRFYQNVFPILGLCVIYLGAVIHELEVGSVRPAAFDPLSRRALVLALSCGVVLIQGSSLTRCAAEMAIEFQLASGGREIGGLMRTLFGDVGELPSVGVVVAGSIKHSYPGEVVDLMGLNSVEMAHNAGERRGLKNHAAFEKATFYHLRPAIVAPSLVYLPDWEYSPADLRRSFANQQLKNLFDDPEFQRNYVFAAVRKGESGPQKAIAAWISRDYLSGLKQDRRLSVDTFDYEDAELRTSR